MKAAISALLSANDPLLYAGEGVLYADATEELRQFAELARLLALTTLKAKSAIPESHRSRSEREATWQTRSCTRAT